MTNHHPEPIRHSDPRVLDTLQRPLRDLRISVTDRCNFRCDYCMPRDVFHSGYRFLPSDQLLRFSEIERLTRIFIELGVRKVRITGGEPLLRPGLPDLIARLAVLPGLEDLALTTNGFLLAPVARQLADAGLQRVTVSLDSLRSETMASECGRRDDTLERVLQGIDAAHEAGLGPVKVNCVVRRHSNLDEISSLARHFRDTPTVLRFIEYMDVGTVNDWTPDSVVSEEEILAAIRNEAALRPLPPQHQGEVARRFGYLEHPGEIGVISSVSNPFCGDCNRARLSADGHLLTCLFACGGIDLRAPLRDNETSDRLLDRLRTTWEQRGDRYSELRAELLRDKPRRRRLEMYQIGG